MDYFMNRILDKKNRDYDDRFQGVSSPMNNRFHHDVVHYRYFFVAFTQKKSCTLL
jgi:hypothetical protein